MSSSLMMPEVIARLASIFVRVPSSPLSTISFKRRVAGWNLPRIGLEHINKIGVVGPTGSGKLPGVSNVSLGRTQTSCVSLQRCLRSASQAGHVFQPRVPSWSIHSEDHWAAMRRESHVVVLYKIERYAAHRIIHDINLGIIQQFFNSRLGCGTDDIYKPTHFDTSRDRHKPWESHVFSQTHPHALDPEQQQPSLPHQDGF
jgi:hypothetical protein